VTHIPVKLPRKRFLNPKYVQKSFSAESYQRWSPRGHGLGLTAPRGQLVVSLALALKVKSLALGQVLGLRGKALGLDPFSLVFRLIELVL